MGVRNDSGVYALDCEILLPDLQEAKNYTTQLWEEHATSLSVWHDRLGHTSTESITKVVHDELVIGVEYRRTLRYMPIFLS